MINSFNNGKYNISYTSKGSGKDILFLHGFPSNMFMWSEIENELIKKNFRVTKLEQRGYPLSSLKDMNSDDFTIDKLSSDVEILIKTLDLSNNLTLVGHDWGTVVAWSVLKRNTVSISNYLSICGGTLFPGSNVYSTLKYRDGDHYITSFQKPKDASKVLDKNIRKTLLGSYRTKNEVSNVSLSLTSLFNDDNHREYAISTTTMEELIIQYEKFGFFGPVSWYANLDKNIELADNWIKNEVTQNITFMFGTEDRAVLLTDKMRERLIKEADIVNIKEIAGAGHWLPHTHKESVLNEIYTLTKDN